MGRDPVRSTRGELTRLAGEGLDWIGFATAADRALSRVVPFTRSCWHTVDPGTVLFTGSLNRNIGCSGSWLAEYEYVVEDVTKWSFLARSGRRAGATSLATHGDLSRSARHRSHAAYGLGDELRASLVTDGVYWGAAGFLREAGQPWFTENEVRLLAALSQPLAEGFRRALLATSILTASDDQDAPGVIVFDEHGQPESISPAAERWIAEMVEIPAPATPADSKPVRIVAAQARAAAADDPLHTQARSRVQTRSGRWLLLYGTPLSGGTGERTAVIIQPATSHEVVPLLALAYGLSERERQVTGLCIQGRSTKQIARALAVSPYTVQDHLKAIFDKTGVHTRGELVGQVFLEHYVPRWEPHPDHTEGWQAYQDSSARREATSNRQNTVAPAVMPARTSVGLTEFCPLPGTAGAAAASVDSGDDAGAAAADVADAADVAGAADAAEVAEDAGDEAIGADGAASC